MLWVMLALKIKKQNKNFPDFKRCLFFILVSVGIIIGMFFSGCWKHGSERVPPRVQCYQPCFPGGCTEGRRVVREEYLNQVHLGFSSVSQPGAGKLARRSG